jgi:hypothetical protein
MRGGEEVRSETYQMYVATTSDEANEADGPFSTA